MPSVIPRLGLSLGFGRNRAHRFSVETITTTTTTTTTTIAHHLTASRLLNLLPSLICPERIVVVCIDVLDCGDITATVLAGIGDLMCGR